MYNVVNVQYVRVCAGHAVMLFGVRKGLPYAHARAM